MGRDELDALRKHVFGKDVRAAKLPPGSGIGAVHAKLPKRATEFIWSGFKLIASERALGAVRKCGIDLRYGPVFSIDTKQSTSFFAIQLDPIPLYSEQTLREMTLQFCSECGQCWMRDVKAKPQGPQQYLKKKFPDKKGLTRAAEGVEILASEAFIDVVRSQKLTGIEFKEFGIYV